MVGTGGKATVDKAKANDWLEVSASAIIAITDLSPLSLLRAILVFFLQLIRINEGLLFFLTIIGTKPIS